MNRVSALRHRVTTIFIVPIVCCLALSHPSSAGNYFRPHPEVTVNHDSITGWPLVATDACGNVYVAYAEPIIGQVDAELKLRKSSDFGETWGPDILLESFSGSLAFSPFRGLIECDDSGNVYVVYSQAGNPLDIYAIVSNDYGSTWNTPVRLDSSPPFSKDSNRPALSFGPPGTVYVAWDDNGGNSPSSRDDGIYLNVSHDNGVSWNASDLRVDSNPGPFEVLQGLSADDLGHVYVLYGCFDSTPSDNELFLATSDDFGETFQREIRVDSGFPVGGGKLATSPTGHVVAAWSHSDIDGVVYANVSTDFGQTMLAQPVRISQKNPPLNSVGLTGLAVGYRGEVFALWSDFRTGGEKLFFNRSIDYGFTWEIEDTQLTSFSGIQDCSFVATPNGHLFAGYSYARGSVFGVASCDGGVSWSPEIRMNTPSSGGQTDAAIDKAGNAYVVWDVIDPCDIRINRLAPTIGVDIEGPASPVRIPPEGLVFNYDVSLVNNTDDVISNVSVFLDVVKPDGTTTPPIIGPVTLDLPGSFIRTKSPRLRVPSLLPAGEYIVNLKVAGTVQNQARMLLIKD